MMLAVDHSSVHSVLVQARQGYLPPPELTVSEFADAHIIVTSGPLAGTRWQTAFAQYQRGIMDACHEPGVNTVVVMGSSQWGKTACAVNVVAYHIAHNPCPILVVEPTVDPMAKEFARNRLEPIIAASPILRDTVSRKRAKDSSNTTLAKNFRGGSVSIAGANSAASLASRAVRVLILDEPDRYPPELAGEGSTISIAIKRTQAYGRRRLVILIGSPTLEDAPIHAWFKRGDQRRYYVPCPACDHMHAYEWKQVKWTDDDPATARLHCPACDYGIGDAERVAILSRGEFRPEKPGRRDKSVVSIHVWEGYSPLSSLSQIVSVFIDAREKQKAGDNAEMHTWQNTTLGEPVASDAGEKVDTNILLTRRESYGEGIDVPAGACCLTMGVDVQDDRLEALVIGWGPGEESWLVDRHVFNGDTSQPGPWAELDDLLDRQYDHESGQRLMIHSTCIDSAGHRTNLVYDYAFRKADRRVYAIIGRDGNRPIISSPSPRRWGRPATNVSIGSNKNIGLDRSVPLYTIGVDAAKALLISRLKLTVHGPGYVHMPVADWCDQELAEQLTSEVLKKKHTRGVPVQYWVKTRTRNEALDMSVYAIAAMKLLNPKLAQMLATLNMHAQRDPSPGGAVPPKALVRPVRRVSRSSYVGR